MGLPDTCCTVVAIVQILSEILKSLVFMTFFAYLQNSYGITFERIELEGWNLLQSTPNVKLHLGRNRHDFQIIILAKIANLTLFYYLTFMNFHFWTHQVREWIFLQSTSRLI